jgi:hypothetical protein
LLRQRRNVDPARCIDTDYRKEPERPQFLGGDELCCQRLSISRHVEMSRMTSPIQKAL